MIDEPESLALAAELLNYEGVVTSELAIVEVTRAAVRAAGDDGAVRAGAVLDAVHLLRLDRRVLDRSARLAPRHLRSLDAIHVASALEVGATLELLAYDDRLLAAARASGLRTLSPA